MADPVQLDILKEGVSVWNQWREENSDAKIDLTKADLRDAEYPGINLRSANLTGCNLRGAILDGANLSSAMLTSVNLTGAQLRKARLLEAVGTNINFGAVDASGAIFSEVDFRNCHLDRAIFRGANLKGGNFRDSSFQHAKLTQCNLTGTDFRDSRLDSVNFENSSLEGADLRRSILSGASLKSANLSKVKANDVEFSGADFTDAVFTATDIRKVRGLTCDRLIKARDWESAFRDDELACDAAIPEKEAADSVVHEPTITKEASVEAASIDIPVVKRATDGRIVLPLEVASSADELLGTELSHWREDIDQAELKAQIGESRNALIELEKALADMAGGPEQGGIGHNNPPEPLIPDVIINQYKSEIGAVVALHDAPRPNKAAFSRLQDMLSRLRDWLQPRIDIAADSAAKTIGKDIGHALVALVAGAVIGLGVLIEMMIS